MDTHFATAPFTLRTAAGLTLEGSHDTLETAVEAATLAARRLACDVGVMGTKTIFGHAVPSCVRIIEKS